MDVFGLIGHNRTVSKSKQFWTPEEDALLRRFVIEIGPNHWGTIAKCIGNGRTSQQCSKRWNYKISPNIVDKNYSHAEDEFILYMQSRFGNKWAEISRFLNGRSPLNIKNRYNVLLRSQNCVKSEIVLESELISFLQENPTVKRTKFTSEYMLRNGENVVSTVGMKHRELFLLPHNDGDSTASSQENVKRVKLNHCEVYDNSDDSCVTSSSIEDISVNLVSSTTESLSTSVSEANINDVEFYDLYASVFDSNL